MKTRKLTDIGRRKTQTAFTDSVRRKPQYCRPQFAPIYLDSKPQLFSLFNLQKMKAARGGFDEYEQSTNNTVRVKRKLKFCFNKHSKLLLFAYS